VHVRPKPNERSGRVTAVRAPAPLELSMSFETDSRTTLTPLSPVPSGQGGERVGWSVGVTEIAWGQLAAGDLARPLIDGGAGLGAGFEEEADRPANTPMDTICLVPASLLPFKFKAERQTAANRLPSREILVACPSRRRSSASPGK
jgi:hypothetical protein